MATRQRAPAIKDRELITCTECEGRAINPDHHPAGALLTDCCPGCNGLGKIDKKLGPLPTEQVAQVWRGRAMHLNNRAKHLASGLASIRAAFEFLHTESHRPHPAAETLGTGHLQAKRVD